MDFPDHSQALIYAACYFGTMIIIASWEGIRPLRGYSQPMGLRWFSHFSLTLINSLLIRALFPFSVIMLATKAEEAGFGLLHAAALPQAVASIVALLLMDLGTWCRHWLLHRVPMLWRVHSAHHSDPDFDFTTGLRFHPLEACFTFIADVAVIALLGAPPVAVTIYLMIQAVQASFTHGNLRLPTTLDNPLRWLIITPELHRIHHSARVTETNSNYGAITPWWDRLFNTYRATPLDDPATMTLGLFEHQSVEAVKLHRILLQPFTQPGTVTATAATRPPADPAASGR
jgi:sterol desaturase/sphingolipid hydroxylase (fatty acid hydroxylase superfamily)